MLAARRAGIKNEKAKGTKTGNPFGRPRVGAVVERKVRELRARLGRQSNWAGAGHRLRNGATDCLHNVILTSIATNMSEHVEEA